MTTEAALLRQIKASAGAGKTHALTEAFLALLAGCRTVPDIREGGGDEPDGDSRLACARAREEGHAWPEILAVTFTNKAATEMKERVLSALKDAALGKAGAAPGFPPPKAAAALEAVLRRYHRLNIRTIDSLLTLVMRLFALEAGISPDFELAFDPAEVHGPVLDRFLARCETDGAARDLFDAALESMVRQENKRGFDLSEAIRKRLNTLITLVRAQDREFEDDPTVLAQELTGPYEAFRQAARDLAAKLHPLGLPLNANFSKYLDKCLAAQLFDGPPDSAMARKESFRDCVNKAGKAQVDEALEQAYARLQRTQETYAPAQARIRGALLLAPCLRLAKTLLAEVREYEAERGVVVGSALAAQAAGRLSRDEGVTEAFCRMGARLKHLLIDEFQDTSREQWAALFPLAEECLSKAGSLSYVGDVKQAIYGWRGGDSALFEEVLASPLSRLAPPERRTLPHNWRSRRAVVEFNNAFFAALGNPRLAGDLARTVLPDGPESEVLELADDLVRAFAGSEQSLPPGKDAEGGYVRLERLPGLDPDPEEEALAETELKVREILARREPRDVAVLVRSNAQAAKVCDRLLAAEVPVVTENSLRLATHPVVRQLAAFLAFLDQPLDGLALAAFVTGREVFGAESGLCAEEVHDWLCRRGKGPAYLSFRREFPGAWDRLLDPFFRKAGLMGAYDLVSEAVRVFRVLERRPLDELCVRRFLEVIRLAQDTGRGSPAAFLEYWEESGGEEKVPLPQGLNAVRIMTVHKAKGLQFPVVVVPFHGFVARVGEEEHHVDEAGGRPLLLRLQKNLGAPHARSLAKSAREALHTLYVAWTRAEEELYGFLPPDLGPEPPSGKAGPLPALALCSLVLGAELEKAGGRIERGVAPEFKADLYEAEPAPEPTDLPPAPEGAGQLMGWLPRLRIYRHALLASGHEERLRGEGAHKALELLRVPDSIRKSGEKGKDGPRADGKPAGMIAGATAAQIPAQAPRASLDQTSDKVIAPTIASAIESAVTGALDFFPGLAPRREALSAEYRDMLAWVLAQPELPGLMARGRPEAEIMDAEGRVHRADLLVRDAEGITVLEYKTGAAQPGHRAQLGRYLALLAASPALGPSPRVRGLLVYLDERRVEPVTVPAVPAVPPVVNHEEVRP
jgi:ATP-dependent exoDNAse (exonuclease V) beta subunit